MRRYDCAITRTAEGNMARPYLGDSGIARRMTCSSASACNARSDANQQAWRAERGERHYQPPLSTRSITPQKERWD